MPLDNNNRNMKFTLRQGQREDAGDPNKNCRRRKEEKKRNRDDYSITGLNLKTFLSSSQPENHNIYVTFHCDMVTDAK